MCVHEYMCMLVCEQMCGVCIGVHGSTHVSAWVYMHIQMYASV